MYDTCVQLPTLLYKIGEWTDSLSLSLSLSLSPPPSLPSGNGHIETAEWLLKTDITGKLISAKDKNGDTPAHDAAENG